jgi:3-methyladenine DNA glycosylase/8-oxoguanine DNA glycosylase
MVARAAPQTRRIWICQDTFIPITKAGTFGPNVEKALAAADPKLGVVIAAVKARTGPQQIAPSHATPFEALVRAIVYQGVSGKVAAAIFSRLREKVGKPFSPAKVLGMSKRPLASPRENHARS